MRITYYEETDSLYIGFNEKPGADVVTISEGVVVDVDKDGVPVGVDIDAYASRIVDLSKLEVEGPIPGLRKVEIQLKETERRNA